MDKAEMASFKNWTVITKHFGLFNGLKTLITNFTMPGLRIPMCVAHATVRPRGLWFSESFFWIAKLFQSPCSQHPGSPSQGQELPQRKAWELCTSWENQCQLSFSGTPWGFFNTQRRRLNKHWIKRGCSLSCVGLHKEQIYFTKMAYFQSLGDKCNLCLDHCWYRPLKLFLDGVTPRRFSIASSMSDSHRAASLMFLCYSISTARKETHFVHICSYLMDPCYVKRLWACWNFRSYYMSFLDNVFSYNPIFHYL